MEIRELDENMSVTAQITVADIDRIKAMGFKSIPCACPDAEQFGQPLAGPVQVRLSQPRFSRP